MIFSKNRDKVIYKAGNKPGLERRKGELGRGVGGGRGHGGG